MVADPTCRRCRAPLLWVRTAATGKWMPLDPEPREDGNVAIDLSTGMAHVLAGAERDEVAKWAALYVSHFATCPERPR